MGAHASCGFRLIRFRCSGHSQKDRLPDVIPQKFEYEIELKPDGPVTVTGTDPKQLRGAFPFHSLKLPLRVARASCEASVCCDKNVMVPCSERVRVDQNASKLSSGKRLKNHIQ